MPGDGLRAPVVAMFAHAGAVDQAADAMDRGRTAAAHVQMGADAYGKLCAFLPGLIDRLAEPAAEALNESVVALWETAANLRRAAANIDAADQASAARVDRVGEPIELPL